MRLINISNSLYDLNKFGGKWYNFEKFLDRNKLDGIELILYKDRYLNQIKDKHLKGLHLKYFPTWLEFYNGDEEKLDNIFKDKKSICEYYGGLKPEAIINTFKEEYRNAKNLNVEYMVYHVGHVTNEDAFSFNFDYSDYDVLDATVEIVNNSFNYDSDILLLFENLWWPGMNLLDYKKTKYFLDKIKYKNKGIMLDLSHLMITNSDLKNAKEATDYILNKIKGLKEIKKYIKGIHLNMSLSGEYLKKDHSKTYDQIKILEGNLERYKMITNHIKMIDKHLPYNHKSINRIIDFINPKYIVYEFNANNIEQLESYVKLQNEVLGV